MKNKNIIYIIGAGRSGTTLLDILLGNEEGIFSAGELNRYTKRSGVPHDPRDTKVSDFWQRIKSSVSPIPDQQLSHHLEYHTAFIKKSNNKEVSEYQRFNTSLFEAISNNIEEKIIIDSSKYPARALELSKLYSNISYILLQRNPAAVSQSFRKKGIEQPTKTPLMANLYLLIVNTLSYLTIKKLSKTHKVSLISYDSLVEKPLDTFNQLERDLNLPLTTIKDKIVNKTPFDVGYLFDGNRLRLKNQVTILNSKKSTQKHWVDILFEPIHKLFWYKKAL